jgi:hypothetical protein
MIVEPVGDFEQAEVERRHVLRVLEMSGASHGPYLALTCTKVESRKR